MPETRCSTRCAQTSNGEGASARRLAQMARAAPKHARRKRLRTAAASAGAQRTGNRLRTAP
eukprot:11160676-Lingulodinium_polyedra.AAC.1